MASGSTKAVLAAMVANGGIAVAKFVGFAFTGAASMLAEAVHSVADTGNQALLLWGARAGSRQPDQERPFGYGRERFFWAFIVALVMFSMGGLYAILEGIDKLRHPHELSDPAWAMGILGMAIVLETGSFAVAYREAKAVKGDADWWSFIRRTRVPELPTVLLEDLGALLGLVFAFAGVGLAAATGEVRFDALGSIAIGVLLVVIAALLASEMRSLLIGEAATKRQESQIQQVVAAAPHVNRLIHARTQYMGPEDLLVGLKVEFGHGLTTEELSRAIDELERRIRECVGVARFVYVEPAIFQQSAAPAPSQAE